VIKSLTPDTARAKALELLGTLASGTDPFAPSLSAETFGAEVERYLLRKKGSMKPRSFIEDQRYLLKCALPLHKLSLSDIDRRTVAVLLGQVETASGPFARNRLRSSLSAFFAWAIQEGLSETNPVQGTGRADEGRGRERVLAPDELRKLWHGLGSDRFSEIVRLLLLTGQRRTEISGLTWAEANLERKVITLGPERTKNSRSHEVPLSTQALAIIARQPRGALVFSERGFTDWARGKAALDQRIGIKPWKIHDLRRTFATMAAELGVLPHVVESVLNHVSGHKAGVAGRYNHARYADEMRSALQRWADHLDKVTSS
jgi:integrase